MFAVQYQSITEPRHEKTCFAIGEQQRRRSDCAGAQSDQRLSCSLLDSIIHLVSISETSSLQLVSVAEQAGLSLNWSQTLKTGFLLTELNTLNFHVSCRTGRYVLLQ